MGHLLHGLHHRTAESQEQEKMAFCVLWGCDPHVKPLIYSLRNQDVREALKGIGKKSTSGVILDCPLHLTRTVPVFKRSKQRAKQHKAAQLINMEI